jgi:hypothetical protein
MNTLFSVGLEPSHIGVGITESFGQTEIKTAFGVRTKNNNKFSLRKKNFLDQSEVAS